MNPFKFLFSTAANFRALGEAFFANRDPLSPRQSAEFGMFDHNAPEVLRGRLVDAEAEAGEFDPQWVVTAPVSWKLPEPPTGVTPEAWGITGRCPSQGAMCNCTGACFQPQDPSSAEKSPAVDSPSGGGQFPPSDPPEGRRASVRDDLVVSALIASDEKRLLLAADLADAVGDNYDHVDTGVLWHDHKIGDSIDWLEVAYALQRDWVITRRRSSDATNP